MKLEFDEIVDIFESNKVWSGTIGIIWYGKAWAALEKAGLTSYENAIDRTMVYIRMFTLIMIYNEFCELAFDEHFDYEFYNWGETAGISSFRIGQLVSRVIEDEDYSDYYEDEEYEALQCAFIDIVDSERGNVVDALIKNIGEGGESTILVSMYLTCGDMSIYEDECLDMDEDDEWIEDDEDYCPEPVEEDMTDYEKYEKDIEKYYGDVVNDVTLDKLAAFNWLAQGTYRIR